MKLTIITATYNSSSTLRDTIESVLAQTYKDIEYIIVDGASKDNTLEIAREYEPQFEGKMRIISEPDKGIYDAMNKGIAAATGDVVGILNSDDFYIDNGVLEDIINSFDDTLDAVYGNLYIVDPNDLNRCIRDRKSSPYKSFRTGWHPPHPTFFVRKEIYDKYGCFNIELKIAADYDLMARFIEVYKISTLYINRYIVKMRAGGASTTPSNFKKIFKEELTVVKQNQLGGVQTLIMKKVRKVFYLTKVQAIMNVFLPKSKRFKTQM